MCIITPYLETRQGCLGKREQTRTACKICMYRVYMYVCTPYMYMYLYMA